MSKQLHKFDITKNGTKIEYLQFRQYSDIPHTQVALWAWELTALATGNYSDDLIVRYVRSIGKPIHTTVGAIKAEYDISKFRNASNGAKYMCFDSQLGISI